MQRKRQDRVRELIKRELGEILRRELSVNQVGIVSITDVDLSPDLRHARIFLSFVGTPSQRETATQMVESYRLRFQSMLAQSVILKYAPQLRFETDAAVERGNRVLDILDELERDEDSPLNEETTKDS